MTKVELSCLHLLVKLYQSVTGVARVSQRLRFKCGGFLIESAVSAVFLFLLTL